MIEREFVSQKTKEFYIKKHIENKLKNVGISQIKLKKIPLGEKIIIYTSRPSLIVGSKGSNIKALTVDMKKKFKLENPQIEINEVKDIFLDANIVAERIASSLERFGSARFKGVGHKTMQNVIASGALGVELIISGKIPGSRAKNWRFYRGYLKKCGDVAISGVRSAKKSALLKSGVIGIKVSIMPSDLILPDSIEILDEPVQIIEEMETVEEEDKSSKKTTQKNNTKKAKEVVSKGKKQAKEKLESNVEEKETTTKKVVSEGDSEEKTIPEKIEDKVAEVASEVIDAAEEVVSKVTDKVSEVLHLNKKSDPEKSEKSEK